jgi:hypothetical protein
MTEGGPNTLAEQIQPALKELELRFPNHSIMLVIARADLPEVRPVFAANCTRKWTRKVLTVLLATIEGRTHAAPGGRQ